MNEMLPAVFDVSCDVIPVEGMVSNEVRNVIRVS